MSARVKQVGRKTTHTHQREIATARANHIVSPSPPVEYFSTAQENALHHSIDACMNMEELLCVGANLNDDTNTDLTELKQILHSVVQGMPSNAKRTAFLKCVPIMKILSLSLIKYMLSFVGHGKINHVCKAFNALSNKLEESQLESGLSRVGHSSDGATIMVRTSCARSTRKQFVKKMNFVGPWLLDNSLIALNNDYILQWQIPVVHLIFFKGDHKVSRIVHGPGCTKQTGARITSFHLFIAGVEDDVTIGWDELEIAPIALFVVNGGQLTLKRVGLRSKSCNIEISETGKLSVSQCIIEGRWKISWTNNDAWTIEDCVINAQTARVYAGDNLFCEWEIVSGPSKIVVIQQKLEFYDFNDNKFVSFWLPKAQENEESIYQVLFV